MTWASLNEWICLSYTHLFCARHFNSKALHSQFPFGGISISSNFFSIVESSFIRQMCPTSADTRFKPTKSITWKIEWKSEHTNALCENIFMTNSFATNWFGYGTDWMPGEFMCIFVLSSINWSRRRATKKNTHTHRFSLLFWEIYAVVTLSFDCSFYLSISYFTFSFSVRMWKANPINIFQLWNSI